VLLATWNVNSLTARLPRVLEFLDRHRPDCLCLQETKVSPEAFPHLLLAEAGYAACDHSGGRWEGVAVLAPASAPPSDPAVGLAGEPEPGQARFIEATVGGVRVASVYVPNGREPGTPPFAGKLAFLAAMAERARVLARSGPAAILGDMNVAPADSDVYDPAAFLGATHVTGEERAALRRLLDAGFVDGHRALHGEAPGFTWWDYRQGHFHRGLGMRIDLALLSADLAGGLRRCEIDRAFRKGPKPSDHAPLLVDVAVPAADLG
jgi:exodeoxyribonuclease-3